MKIFKFVGLFCCTLVLALFAIFLPLQKQTTSFLVKADYIETDYVYNGSTIWVPFTPYFNGSPLTDGSTGYSVLFGNFSFTISKPDDTSLRLSMSGGGHSGSYYRYSFDYTTTISQSNHGSVDVPFTIYDANGTRNYYIHFWITSNNYSAFIPNIYKIRQNSDWNNETYIGGNHITYYDVNDNLLDISVTCFFKPVGVYSGYTSNPFSFSTRTYYLNTLDSLNDNQLYNIGYQAGLEDNQTNIYNNGVSAGINQGYNLGYQEGIEAASSNNFFTLIGAAVDVPITALTSLLNFTFLGVNLLAFVTSILTLALIIFVIKKFMGKG